MERMAQTAAGVIGFCLLLALIAYFAMGTDIPARALGCDPATQKITVDKTGASKCVKR